MELKCLLDAIKDKTIQIYRERRDFNASIIYGMEQDDAFLFLLQMEIEKMKKEREQLLYGICFSEEGDLLGQWREYADKGRGLSIGFSMKWFERLCEKEKLFKFAKVSYDAEKASSIITEYAEDIYEGILDALVNSKTDDILNSPYGASYSINHARIGIYVESAFIKKGEYAEEKEWRLIIDDEGTRKDYDDWRTLYNWKGISEERDIKGTIYELMPNALEFMTKNGKIISYLDLKYDTNPNDLPIKKIIIGPNCRVSESDIYHILEFFGFDGTEIQIQKSKSSYQN